NEVVKDALEICKEPKYIQVGQRSAAAKTISHSKAEVSHGHKADWLIEHLRKPEGPVLIFSRTKIGADKLARKLQSAGIRCVALHADRTMDQRRQAVEGFRGGKDKVLGAPDSPSLQEPFALRPTPIAQWISAARPSRDSAAGSTRCLSPPTSRRAAST